MILFFDTETTGKPKNYKAPATDLDNWPRIIQLGWALYKDDGTLYDCDAKLIKPDGWKIPEEEFWIKHGYSTQKSMESGIPIAEALHQFLTPLNACTLMVAHNLDFDYPVVAAEMIRADIRSSNKPVKCCTMKKTTDLLKIDGPYGYKYPKLEELHQFLFGKSFEGAHDALNDVKATAACYFKLKADNQI